jgi:hypothetical protein
MMATTQGNRVAWVGVYETHVWRTPAPVNHILHCILSLLTFGLWLLIWVLLAVSQPKPQLVGVAVNEYGHLYMFNAYETPRVAVQLPSQN